MDKNIATLRAEIADLQQALHVLIDKQAKQETSVKNSGYRFFDKDTLQKHKEKRSATIPYMLNLPLRVHVSGPFVYGMVIPIAILDFSLAIYQAVCFRLWGVSRVRRKDHVIIDRHHLAYLNGIEKLNCIFCGYANGVFSLAQELAARTEQFWCPIKHASKVGQSHSYYHNFVDFGDVDAWQDHPSRRKPK